MRARRVRPGASDDNHDDPVSPVDTRRVDLVESILIEILNTSDLRAHVWAKRIVEALDAHDAVAHVHDQRGQMTWADECDPDDDGAPAN